MFIYHAYAVTNIFISPGLPGGSNCGRWSPFPRLNFVVRTRRSPKVVGHKRETARRKSMRRAVLIPRREFRRRLELFLASVAEWEGDVVRLVLATFARRTSRHARGSKTLI